MPREKKEERKGLFPNPNSSLDSWMLSWHTSELMSLPFFPNPDKVITRLLYLLRNRHPQFFLEHHLFRLPFSLCQLSSCLVIYQVYASPIPIRLLLDFMQAYNTWLLAAVGLPRWWRCSVWAPQENRATLENNWPWRHHDENGRCEEWDNRSEAQRPRSNSNIPNNPNNPGGFGPFHSNLLYWYLINQYFIVFAFYFLTQLIFHDLRHQLF